MEEETPKRPVGRPVTTGTTPKQNLRVPADEWAELAEAAARIGSDRTAITREFYAWFLRKPGAKMPKRPEATDA